MTAVFDSICLRRIRQTPTAWPVTPFTLTISLFFIIHFGDGSSPPVALTAPLILPALGRESRLGEFYNAVDETFLGTSVFKGPLSSKDGSVILASDIPHTNSRFVISNSLKEQTEILDIKIEVVISMLFGLIQIRGAAEFLKEDTTTTKAVSAFMDYNVRTRRESIDLLYDSIRPLIMTQGELRRIPATHIVTAIDYGADVVVRFQDQVTIKRTIEDIKGSLAVVMKALGGLFGASGSAEFGKTDKNFNNGNTLSIKMFGDVSIHSQPRTIDDVLNFMKGLPAEVRRHNGGKGKPMQYTLISIDLLLHLLTSIQSEGQDAMSMSTMTTIPENKTSCPEPPPEFTVKIPRLVQQVDPAALQDLLEISEHHARVQTALNELDAEFQKWRVCLPNDDLDRLGLWQSRFRAEYLRFQSEIKATLVAIRSGSANHQQLSNLSRTYQENPFSSGILSPRIQTDFKGAWERIQICSTLFESDHWAPEPAGRRRRSRGVEYLSGPEEFRTVLLPGHRGRNVYVLWYSLDWILEKETNSYNYNARWRNLHGLFLRLQRNPENKMVVIDCGLSAAAAVSCGRIQSTQLHQYRNGHLISSNVLQDLNLSRNYCDGRNRIIKLPALGAFQPMGALYSARTRKFLGGPGILKKSPAAVDSVPTFHLENELIPPSLLQNRGGMISLGQKIKALQIPRPMAVDALAGNFPLSHSGQFLSADLHEDDVGTEEVVSGALISTFGTFLDSIPTDVGASKYFSVSEAFRDDATHFVQQIQYGVTSILQLDAPAGATAVEVDHLYSDLQKIQDFLKKSLLQRDVQNQSLPTTNETIPAACHRLSTINPPTLKSPRPRVKIFSDIFETPQIMEDPTVELPTFIQDLQRGLLKNEMKAEPVAYVLYPLDSMQEIFGVITIRDNPGNGNREREIQIERGYHELIRCFHKIPDIRFQFRSQRLIYTKHDEKVPDSYFTALEEATGALEGRIGEWIQAVRSALPKLQRLEMDEKKWDEPGFGKVIDLLKSQFKRVSPLQTDFSRLDADLSWISEKIAVFAAVADAGSEKSSTKRASRGYLGKYSGTIDSTVFARENPENGTRKVYLLFLSRVFRDKNPALWRETLHAFISLNTKVTEKVNLGVNTTELMENQVLFIVDCDFETNSRECGQIAAGPVIQEWSSNGTMLHHNFTQKLKQIRAQADLNKGESH